MALNQQLGSLENLKSAEGTRQRLFRQHRQVGPGNFTPSPSQIRTGYSRIIRLVPSREGCRLPLNEGLLPANQRAKLAATGEAFENVEEARMAVVASA